MEKRSSTNESRAGFLMRLSLSRNHWLEQALFIEVNFISSIYILNVTSPQAVLIGMQSHQECHVRRNVISMSTICIFDCDIKKIINHVQKLLGSRFKLSLLKKQLLIENEICIA